MTDDIYKKIPYSVAGISHLLLDNHACSSDRRIVEGVYFQRSLTSRDEKATEQIP